MYLILQTLKKNVFMIKTTHNCNEEDKKCLDYTKRATKDICEKAKTSGDGKKCTLSEDNNRCIEIDVEVGTEEKTEQTQSVDAAQNTNESNGKINQIKLISILLCLLIV